MTVETGLKLKKAIAVTAIFGMILFAVPSCEPGGSNKGGKGFANYDGHPNQGYGPAQYEQSPYGGGGCGCGCGGGGGYGHGGGGCGCGSCGASSAPRGGYAGYPGENPYQGSPHQHQGNPHQRGHRGPSYQQGSSEWSGYSQGSSEWDGYYGNNY